MISCSGAPFGPVVALAAVALVFVLLEFLLDHCLGLADEDIDLQLDRLAPDILEHLVQRHPERVGLGVLVVPRSDHIFLRARIADSLSYARLAGRDTSHTAVHQKPYTTVHLPSTLLPSLCPSFLDLTARGNPRGRPAGSGSVYPHVSPLNKQTV